MSVRAFGVPRAWERRQVGRNQREIEGRGPPDLGSGFDHARVAHEPAGLLGATAQMSTGRCRQPRVELVEAAPGTYRSNCCSQPALRRRGVVHVVGGHAGQVVARRQLGQRIVARRVERVAVVPQLDHHTVAPEQLDQPLQLLCRCRRTVVDECRRHGTFAATGQHPTVPAHRVGDVEQGELRRALLAGQMAEAQGPGKACVTAGPVGQHEQMIAVRIGSMMIGHETGGDLLLGVVFGEHLPRRRPSRA